MAVLARTAPLALLAALAAQPPGLQPEPPPIDFATDIRPVLAERCFRCHGERKQKGDIRLDTLDPLIATAAAGEAWRAALDMINGGEMPPADEPQLTDDERRRVVDWLTAALRAAAAAQRGDRAIVMRRLTRAQYSNALQDLLGVAIDFAQDLPADGKSKTGFSNDGAVLQASSLHLDYYRRIARAGLRQAIAPPEQPPVTRYRVTFGKGIGRGLVAAETGGYQSVPLDRDDFRIEVLGDGVHRGAPTDPALVEALQRRISVGLRGSEQDRFRVVDEGMILLSALPHRERVPKAWQGPSPNLKLEMQRCWPERGDFVMRVVASRGYVPPLRQDLLVGLDEPIALAHWQDGAVAPPPGAMVLPAEASDQRQNLRVDGDLLVAVDVPQQSRARLRFDLPADGFYQVDLVHPPIAPEAMPSVRLSVAGHHLDQRPVLGAEQLAMPRVVTPLGAIGMRAGRHHLAVGGPFFLGFSHVVITPLAQDHPLVRRLSARADEQNAAVADLVPSIRALLGTRTDDGMDYLTFGEPQQVRAPLGEPATYEFFGRLENLPIPAPESGDTEILSGFLLLGLWNDHLVKSPRETGPPLLVQSIEFEAPYLPVWPPRSHSAIFFDGDRSDLEAYTREVLARFLARAFRRSVDGEEVERYLGFWRAIRADHPIYEQGVAEVLVAILCSPQFLYLVEFGENGSPLSDTELANRLSFLLWNSPPDAELRALAERGALHGEHHGELLAQTERLLDDARSERFVRAFTYEWLRLDRHAEMTIDVDRHPDYTRFVKRDMAEETYAFVQQVLREDLSIFTFLDSDFAMLNQNLAEFYGVPGVVGPQFRAVAVRPEQRRGGLLSQGSFLVGHSDGSEPHPIKRAVWIKQKILGDPPPPPPPNVPPLDPETPGFDELTLKQQLEAHRDKSSCRDCHAGIDPFGIAFERRSAVGRYEPERKGRLVDALTTLPDGTAIDGVAALQRYLRDERGDDFARALIEHLFAYALGREVHFADESELDAILWQVKLAGYRMRSLIRAIVTSDSFTQR
ncbi:MAG: DUF1592 domain-containing protein [Planctomycetes bacterium]|nr:DUF1592 domain-containing protein [Planctomycetota bacterium]